MKIATAENLKAVAGVLSTSTPIVRGHIFSIRQGRNAQELVQFTEGRPRVVAISDARPQLLSFAAINDLPVKNYTEPTIARTIPKPGPARTPVFSID